MDLESPSCLVADADGVRLRVRLQPKARKVGVAGILGGEVRIGVAAPPVDGKANEALCRYLAEALGLPKGAVVITHGQTSRHKTVHLAGASLPAVAAWLGKTCPTGGSGV